MLEIRIRHFSRQLFQQFGRRAVVFDHCIELRMLDIA